MIVGSESIAIRDIFEGTTAHCPEGVLGLFKPLLS